MKAIRLAAIAGVSALVLGAAPVWASDCLVELADVDAELASGPAVPTELLAAAQAARDEGETLCLAGANDAAVKKLQQAKFMLGMYAQ